MITLELKGLEVFGRHGALKDERRAGQAFWYDLRLDVPDTALSDRLEDAVDYRLVAAKVREVSDAHTYHLLEALAAAVADAIVEAFPVVRVRVRVRKRPADFLVEHAAAVVERTRG